MNKPLLFLVLFLFPSIIFAQKDIYTKPFVSAGFSYVPHKQMTDSFGSFSSQILGMAFSIPIIKKYNFDPKLKKFNAFQLNLMGGYAYKNNEITIIYQDHNLHLASLGLNSLYLINSKNICLAQFHVSLYGDNYNISTPEYRYTGFGLWHHTVTEKFGYHIGMVYTYVFGKAFILPLIGISSNLNNKTRLNVSLPMNVSVTIHPDKQTNLSFYLRPVGYSSVMSSNGIPRATIMDVFKYSETQIQSGISLYYQTTSHIAFSVKTGINFNRKIKLTRGSDDIYIKTGIRPGIFVSFNIFYRFFNKKKNKLNDRSQLEELLDNISPEDIE